MNEVILKIFVINLSMMMAIFLLSYKSINFSNRDRFVIFVAFTVTPVFVAIKGIMSTIYVSDLISPILFWFAMKSYSSIPLRNKKIINITVLLLVILPLFATFINFIFFGYESSQFTNRNMQSLIIWIFRNLIYLSVFILAAAKPINLESFISQLKFVLLLGLGFGFLGVADYSGVIELSSYEIITAASRPDFPFNYTNTTLGWGFLGIFRGSVGQMCANLFCLALAFVLVGRGWWKILATILILISVILVLCSLSRAGMIAIVVSTLMIFMLSGLRGIGMLPVIALGIFLILPVLQIGVIQERIDSIFTYADSTDFNRVDGWLLAIEILVKNPIILFFGNGADNRDGVAQLIGAYGAHNEYIDVIFRSGIFGLVLLVILLRKLWLEMSRKRSFASNKREKVWLSVIPAILVSNIIVGISQDHLYRAYSGYSAGILLFYLYGIGLAVQSRRKTRPKSINLHLDEVQ